LAQPLAGRVRLQLLSVLLAMTTLLAQMQAMPLEPVAGFRAGW
jgi:hypothetical protein